MSQPSSFYRLEQAFLASSAETRGLQLGISSVHKVERALKELGRALQGATPADTMTLMSTHLGEIARCKYATLEQAKQHAPLRALHDRIFALDLGLAARMPRHITMLFEELIKGITYFANQVDPNNPLPVYHRLEACGDGRDPHRLANQVCQKGLGRSEVARRRALIERCFIERIIYDELWSHETLDGEQNDGHVHRLGITRDDYRSCFKNRDIRVRLGYADSMPVTVAIERYHGESLTETETYTKTWGFNHMGVKTYDASVECVRDTARGRSAKVQAFASGAADWVKVKQPAG